MGKLGLALKFTAPIIGLITSYYGFDVSHPLSPEKDLQVREKEFVEFVLSNEMLALAGCARGSFLFAEALFTVPWN